MSLKLKFKFPKPKKCDHKILEEEEILSNDQHQLQLTRPIEPFSIPNLFSPVKEFNGAETSLRFSK
jgi:hypothetical protein